MTTVYGTTLAPTRWADVPHAERAEIAQLEGAAFDHAAYRLGLKPQSLRCYVSRFRRQRQMEVLPEQHTLALPAQSRRVWDDYFVVEAEDGMFISDIHIPNGDVVWLETVLLMAIKHRVRTLFILGDSLDSNQQGISTWMSTWADGSAISFPDSLEMFKTLLRAFLLYFDTIYVIAGNHDQRIAKVTGGQVHIGTLLDGFDARVQVSPYRKMYVTNHRGYVACYHQAAFSSNGVALGRKMYNSENFRSTKPYALITTHIHHWSCGKSEDNLCAVYSLGASEDDSLSQYANETPSPHARRSQSMILMKRGYLRNLERIETDWPEELGVYAAKASICKATA